MANDKLKKEDVILGGKIRCEGCGAEWWLSGPQAEHHFENGWPDKCGNNPDVIVNGSRDDCTYIGEMTFIPYDIDENIAVFRAHGQHKVADGLRAAAEKIKANGGTKQKPAPEQPDVVPGPIGPVPPTPPTPPKGVEG